MKGINVRKIAAIAGAFTLGLSAVAVADVMYGNSQLVDQNGQPTVKIYVGSKAQISDGIAAANIAAKIANEAYKSSTLTAQVSGTPACTVGTGASGAGTCSIVESSKKVTLAVTVPGTVAGAHTFKTLITDTIDKTLANRNNTRSEDNYTSALTSSDTSGSVTSPLRAADGDVVRAKNLYRIGSGQFTAFGDANLVDNQATGVTYTQEQAFWIGSTANGVVYDSSSLYKDVIVNKYRAMVYSTKFSGNDFGISVCTGDLNSTGEGSNNWASCDTESNSRTDRHRLKVKFLGSDWIISEMNDPSLTDASGVTAIAGGQIKLAKEAKYGIINVGQSLDAGIFKVRLSDISVAVGSANVHPAILDVLDANDQVVGQIQVNPGSTYTFTQSGTSDSVKIHVYKTAPGFTLSAKWAEMAIYNDEITLKDGQRYNLVSSSDTDKDFKVSLMWKNRDYTGSSGGNDSSADSLREVVLYNIDGLDSKNKAGDSFSFPKGTPVYKLTYNGLDLTDDDYQALTFSALSPDTYRVAATSGDQACGATSSLDASYASAKWIQISTSGNQYLGGSGTNLIAGGVMVDKAWFDPIGLVTLSGDLNISGVTANATSTLPTGYQFATTTANVTGATSNITAFANVTQLTPTTYAAYNTGAAAIGWVVIPAAALLKSDVNGSFSQNANVSKWQPKVFWKLSGRDCYNWAQATYQANANATTDSAAVRFEKAGDNTAALGGIFFSNNPASIGDGTLASTFQGSISVKEDAGYYGTTSNNPVYTAVPFIANGSSSTSGTNGLRFKSSDSTTQNAYYQPLAGAASWVATEPTIVTERGSKILSVGTSDFSMKVAKKIGQPSFTFANADTTSTSGSNAEEYTMNVGESKVFGGVTVLVKAIDATAGSCSVLGANGAPACTVDSTSLTAVVMPNNAASVVVNEPYTGSVSGLVMKDTDGPSANVAILVGGPAVNTMTAEALKDATVDFQKEGVVVKEIGKKIVVAGYTAEDTMAAADLFVKGVQRQ